MQRLDARACDALRPIRLETQIMGNAGGSVLIRWGNTHVLCSVMLEEQTARFLTGSGKGWLTAEYAMLPASTPTRKARDGLKPDGRSVEIKRLIGRSLRAVVDFSALGSAPFGWIATCYAPTAARARPPSPALMSPWRWESGDGWPRDVSLATHSWIA